MYGATVKISTARSSLEAEQLTFWGQSTKLTLWPRSWTFTV